MESDWPQSSDWCFHKRMTKGNLKQCSFCLLESVTVAPAAWLLRHAQLHLIGARGRQTHLNSLFLVLALFFVPVMRDVLDLFHFDPLIQHLVPCRMVISFLWNWRCIGARRISRAFKVTQRRFDDWRPWKGRQKTISFIDTCHKYCCYLPLHLYISSKPERSKQTNKQTHIGLDF